MRKKFRFGLNFKFVSIMTLGIIVTSVVFVWFFITVQTTLSKTFMERRISSLTNMLAISGGSFLNTANINSFTKNLVEEEDIVYFVTYDVNGKQLASNVMTDEHIEQYVVSTPVSSDVIKNLKQSGTQQNMVNIKDIGTVADIIVPVLEQYVPFDSKKETCVGAFRVGVAFEKQDYLIQEIKKNIFILTLLIVILEIVTFSFLIKKITRPIKELLIGVKKNVLGNLSYRVPIISNDEFRDLTVSFNFMTADMETYINALSKEKEELLNLKIAFEQRNLELEETLKKNQSMQQDLIKSEKFATIGKLSSSIAHELRNPLTAIKNISYFLSKMDSFKDDKTKQMVEMLSSEVLRTNKIVTELLDYSRIKKLTKLSLDVKNFIDKVVTMVPIQENIKLIKKIENFDIVFDPDKITQVIINLISNARDAMPPEGGEITISAKKTDTTGQIFIQDNACGMSEDTVAHLFEPLFTTKLKGIGLGLPIVKEIIDAHQGKISVISKENVGTTFIIELPLK